MPSSRAPPSDMWLPKTYEDLEKFPALHQVDEFRPPRVVRAAPGIIFKFSEDLYEEAVAMRFAREKVKLLVPQILHHPRLRRPSPHAPRSGRKDGPSGVWYISMEECSGVPLHTVIDTMAPEELDHIAEQLKSFLTQMASVKSKTLGNVLGHPYRNEFFPPHLSPKHAFTTVGEFIDHYRWILMLFCTEKYTESLLCLFPRNSAIRFTHGDLLPKNIMVSESTITGILDWATAGFYPEFWEYSRMHDPVFMTQGWEYVLGRVYPRERPQSEKYIVRVLRDILYHNC